MRPKNLYKKAVLFTLISVLLAALFIALFSYNTDTQANERILYTNTRIKVVDTYVKNFEKYAQSSIEVSSYKTLESLANRSATQQRDFFNNEQEFKQAFEGCLKCGYVDCDDMSAFNLCPGPLRNASVSYDLNASLARIADLAEDNMNIKTEYSINSVNITQTYPFQVEVTVDISYNISDNLPDGITRWQKHANITETVTIIGLSDPLFAVNTEGAYSRHIMKTSLCEFNQTCWNVTTVSAFYAAGHYKHDQNSTSYLSRFWNSTRSSECCGIETLINASAIGRTFENKSYVDNAYWYGRYVCNLSSNVTILRINSIDNSSGGFRLDSQTAARYNIANLANDSVRICPT